jgi:endogenous inhibitor of DNA gyrase (YacG/DUF329 family)
LPARSRPHQNILVADPNRTLSTRDVLVVDPRGGEHPTKIRVSYWTEDQRAKRAMKRLGLWWGGAVLGAFMPPHIPWFTIGFFGGPVAAWLAAREGSLIHDQDVACPVCGAPTHIDEQPESWPLGARCKPCHLVFWINAAPPPADADADANPAEADAASPAAIDTPKASD